MSVEYEGKEWTNEAHLACRVSQNSTNPKDADNFNSSFSLYSLAHHSVEKVSSGLDNTLEMENASIFCEN